MHQESEDDADSSASADESAIHEDDSQSSDSSSESSESSGYSDWVADQGVNLEPPKRSKRRQRSGRTSPIQPRDKQPPSNAKIKHVSSFLLLRSTLIFTNILYVFCLKFGAVCKLFLLFASIIKSSAYW